MHSAPSLGQSIGSPSIRWAKRGASRQSGFSQTIPLNNKSEDQKENKRLFCVNDKLIEDRPRHLGPGDAGFLPLHVVLLGLRAVRRTYPKFVII